MTLQERAKLYQTSFPSSPVHVVICPGSNPRLESTWIIGNSYGGSRYHGSYPGNYLKRVMSLFPDVPGQKILHLFSGSLPPGDYYRVDANPKNTPDWVADAHEISSIKENMLNRFDLIIADPPYSSKHAEKYGFKMIDRRKVLEECHKVLSLGSWLIWLDEMSPIFSKAKWHWGMWFPIFTSTNRRMRAVFGFQKKERD